MARCCSDGPGRPCGALQQTLTLTSSTRRPRTCAYTGTGGRWGRHGGVGMGQSASNGVRGCAMRGRRTGGTGRLQRVERARALSTDMRSCWKAANPGGVSRGAAVAGVRAASAMERSPGSPPAEERAFPGAHTFSLKSLFARYLLCLSKLALVAASAGRARSPYGPTAGRAARVRTAWHRAAGGRSQRACRPLRQAYHPAHDARGESRPRCLDPGWEELVQFIGARRRAPVPRWSCASFHS